MIIVSKKENKARKFRLLRLRPIFVKNKITLNFFARLVVKSDNKIIKFFIEVLKQFL